MNKLNKTTQYGGFWRRLVAYFIDYALVYIILLCLGLFLGLSLSSLFEDETSTEVFSFIVGITIFWLYSSLLESSRLQATLGKLLMGMQVTDENYKKISFLKATGRHFSKILSGLLLGVGFLMIGFSEKKQGLHDEIAGTYVILKSGKGKNSSLIILIGISILILPLIGSLAYFGVLNPSKLLPDQTIQNESYISNSYIQENRIPLEGDIEPDYYLSYVLYSLEANETKPAEIWLYLTTEDSFDVYIFNTKEDIESGLKEPLFTQLLTKTLNKTFWATKGNTLVIVNSNKDKTIKVDGFVEYLG